jgi:hypothetical protein
MVRREASPQKGDLQCIYCCLPCIVCCMCVEKILQSFCVGALWICVKTQKCFEFIGNKMKRKNVKIKNEENTNEENTNEENK